MPARISMTQKQRDALLALPETENEVIRHYTLDAVDLAAIASSRAPERDTAPADIIAKYQLSTDDIVGILLHLGKD